MCAAGPICAQRGLFTLLIEKVDLATKRCYYTRLANRFYIQMTVATVMSYLETIPSGSILAVLVSAVLLAPFITRLRLRSRRLLTRFLWLALGFALGWTSAVYFIPVV